MDNARAAEEQPPRELVLLIEDEADVRRIARFLLQRQGFDVVAAATLGEARDVWNRLGSRIAIVFTDISLPDGNGWALAKEILQQQPSTQFIYTSGNNRETDAEQHGLHNVIFVPKPYSVRDLEEAFRLARQRDGD